MHQLLTAVAFLIAASPVPTAAHAQVSADSRASLCRQLKHHIGQGWFLYREPGDKDYGHYLSGEAGPRPQLSRLRYMLGEEPTLRSSLPKLRYEPFQMQLEQSFINNKVPLANIRQAGGRRSFRIQCSGDITA